MWLHQTPWHSIPSTSWWLLNSHLKSWPIYWALTYMPINLMVISMLMAPKYLITTALDSPLQPQFLFHPTSPSNFPISANDTTRTTLLTQNLRPILIPFCPYLLVPIHYQVLWDLNSKTYPQSVSFSAAPLPPWQVRHQGLGLLQ